MTMSLINSQLMPLAWAAPSSSTSLGEGEVSVWKLDPNDLTLDMDRFKELLSVTERLRLERYADPAARREFVICRGVLHMLLSFLSGGDMTAVEIHEDRNGKPHMDTDGHTHPLEFNIAHTRGLCLIACSREMEMGVDVERIQALPELEDMACKYLAPLEMAQWRETALSQRTDLFYRFWSAKEALLKALGSGLRIPPAQVDTIEVLAGGSLSGRQDDGYYFEVGTCLLEALPLPDHYAGWMAVLGCPQKVSLYEMTDHWLDGAIFSMGRNVEK
jgi:4'-phosphopantetheinyl transferase